jgi:hypothetical protein
MSCAVRFAVQVGYQIMITEADLPIVIEVLGAGFPRDYLPGAVVFMAAGQTPVQIEDDLEFCIQQLLEAVPALAAGQPASIGYSEAPGHVDFTPDGDGILVLSELFTPFRADAGELLSAIVACGSRFVALCRTRLGEEPGLAARADQLDPWVHAASEALRPQSR